MDRTSYPHAPGVRPGATGETSQAAADFIAPHVAGICARVVDVLAEGAATPEEITAAMHLRGERALLTTIRARCTQLTRLGMVCDSGSRGIGESGKVRAIRWRLTTEHERTLWAADRAREGRQ